MGKNIKVLKIGDFLINERYFIGLYSTDNKHLGNEYVCTIYAKWQEGNSVLEEGVHSYFYNYNDNPDMASIHMNEMKKALEIIGNQYEK